MKTGKKKAPEPSAKARRAARLADKNNRRERKLELRKKEKKKAFTAEQWAIPAPSHLVARLERPKHKSKYHSYFEFAENTEKKKHLEHKVTNDSKPPPGFKFVPIGDPVLTNECKEISRESGAMIFIVSASREEKSKISEHIYRTGYHFRETIVDAARAKLGGSTISTTTKYQEIEPIPESQQEINKQADGAIRDLFPRIPNPDRQMIIEHAFKKGALFHGEPTVGLQPNISLSRRVQLAVLAHIRHTHTRYDQLLRETTWMNARKVVEPVCLDVLVRWRGDEETGRDQMDEILREVVIITDSEDSDDSSEEDDTSDEEDEVTSPSSGNISHTNSRNQMRSAQQQIPVESPRVMLSRPPPSEMAQAHREKQAQRGFKRYQAAWEQAVSRQHPSSSHQDGHLDDSSTRTRHSDVRSPSHRSNNYSRPVSPGQRYLGAVSDQARRHDGSAATHQQDHHYYLQQRLSSPNPDRNKVPVSSERPMYYQNSQGVRTSSPSNKEQRLPVLVRGSPSHGLQDMLVPSIETGSSDALAVSPRPIMRRDAFGDFEKDRRSRLLVEHRRQSPSATRQVIIIEDDSPQYKRRRVIQEDDTGRFRPLPSHDQRLYTTAPRADSHLIPASSVDSRDFLIAQPSVSSQSGQGLFRDRIQQPGEQSSEQRIPIYNAPAEFDYFPPNSGQLRRTDGGSGTQRELSHTMRYVSPRPHTSTVGSEYVRPVKDGRIERQDFSRQVESGYNHTGQIQQLPLPTYPTRDRDSHSRELGPGPVVADQAFIHNFSQSRIDHSLSRPGDGFRILESSNPTIVSPRNNPHPHRYGDHLARSSESSYQGQEQYLRRPTHYQDDMGQQSPPQMHSYDRGYLANPQSLPLRDGIPGQNASPYMGNVGARRQLTLLD